MSHHIYLSGPMTNIEDFNYPAFNEAADYLRKRGHSVFNPAESFEGDQSLPWTTYMRKDIAQLVMADEVRVLPGWETSTGACLEVAVAVAMGIPVCSLDGFDLYAQHDPRDIVRNLLRTDSTFESILEEADRLVHSNRGADYGHPYYDFRRTALMLTGLLVDRLKDGESIGPRDIPLMMNCVKMSREINKPKRDNRVDGAGYWETLDMVDQLEGTL